MIHDGSDPARRGADTATNRWAVEQELCRRRFRDGGQLLACPAKHGQDSFFPVFQGFFTFLQGTHRGCGDWAIQGLPPWQSGQSRAFPPTRPATFPLRQHLLTPVRHQSTPTLSAALRTRRFTRLRLTTRRSARAAVLMSHRLEEAWAGKTTVCSPRGVAPRLRRAVLGRVSDRAASPRVRPRQSPHTLDRPAAFIGHRCPHLVPRLLTSGTGRTHHLP